MVETENNSMTVTTSDGTTRPAWGTSYDLTTNIATPMTVTSNTFCAGGMSLADGRWAVFGGNQPVTYNGSAVKDQPDKANPYGNTDGGAAIRLLTPCDGGGCEYQEGGDALTMTVSERLHDFGHTPPLGFLSLIEAGADRQGKRWYPTIEGLADGSVIVIGGDQNGG